MTLQAAIEELAGRCDARKAPTISDPEMEDILARQQYVSLFSAGGVYGRGQLVLPSTASLYAAGAAYAVLTPGVASTEPSTWPSAPGTIAYSGSVQLVFWGVYDGVPWDRQAAAREALQLKVARTARLVDTADRDTKNQFSQMLAGYQRALDNLGPAMRGFF